MDLQEALKKIKDLEKDNKVLSTQVSDLESDKSDLDEVVDKLTTNNEKQQKELRSARSKNRDEDGLSDKLNESEDKVIDLQKLLDTQGKDMKTIGKQLETANQSIVDKDGLLETHLLDGGLNKFFNNFDKHTLNEGASELAIMDLKARGAKLVEDKIMVGDVALDDYGETWLSSASGKNLVREKANNGGGAGGGNNNGNHNETPQTTKETFDEMFQTK